MALRSINSYTLRLSIVVRVLVKADGVEIGSRACPATSIPTHPRLQQTWIRILAITHRKGHRHRTRIGMRRNRARGLVRAHVWRRSRTRRRRAVGTTAQTPITSTPSLTAKLQQRTQRHLIVNIMTHIDQLCQPGTRAVSLGVAQTKRTERGNRVSCTPFAPFRDGGE